MEIEGKFGKRGKCYVVGVGVRDEGGRVGRE